MPLNTVADRLASALLFRFSCDSCQIHLLVSSTCVFWATEMGKSLFQSLETLPEQKQLPESSLRDRTKELFRILTSSELAVMFIISLDIDQKSESWRACMHTSKFYKHCLEHGIVMTFLTQKRFALCLDNS